ncbi:MAG: RNA-binding protein [bacterium]|nr:MAG: RNA-binding protein [bacterium]
MAKNLYVGNIPFSMSDEQLGEIFNPYGTVSSSRVIRDRFTGRSRGFGFVEMDDPEEAEKAVGELNGKTVEGRIIKVSEARPREDRGRPGDGRRDRDL